MRYQVKLKSTMTWWETIDIPDEALGTYGAAGALEYAAGDAVALAAPEQRAQVALAGECE